MSNRVARASRAPRYAHAVEYVTRAAEGAGLELLEATPFTPRWEGGRPVDGTLYLLHKP